MYITIEMEFIDISQEEEMRQTYLYITKKMQFANLYNDIEIYKILALFWTRLKQKLYFAISNSGVFWKNFPKYTQKPILYYLMFFVSDITFDLLFWQDDLKFFLVTINLDFNLHIFDCCWLILYRIFWLSYVPVNSASTNW